MTDATDLPQDLPQDLLADDSADDLSPVSEPSRVPPRVFGARQMPISEIVPGPNPRHRFEQEAMRALVSSIKLMGILQPIAVRPADLGDGADDEVPERYIIIAGERRYRAAKLARLEEVPVTILHVSELEALEMTLAENLEREALDPVEEGRGFAELIKRGRTQQQLGERLNKSQTWINNRIRLLRLPVEVQEMISDREIDLYIGVALVTLDRYPDKINELARLAVENKWTVKEVIDQVAVFRAELENHRQPRMALDSASVPAEEAQVKEMLGEPDGGPAVPPDFLPENEAEDTTEGAEAETPPLFAGTSNSGGFAEPGPVVPVPAERPPVTTTVKIGTLTTDSVLDTNVVDLTAKAAASAPSPNVPAPRSTSPTPPVTASSKTPTPAATPPAAAPTPKPSLPPGMMNVLQKQEDIEALQAEGLWPLAKVREELARRRGGDGESVAQTPTPKTAAPDALQAALLSPPTVVAALKLAEFNRTSESVFTNAETDLLNQMFPVRETTTPGMVMAVLLQFRLIRVQGAMEAHQQDVENAARIAAEQSADDQSADEQPAGE